MKRRFVKARERIAWGAPVIVLGGECKAADPLIANGTLMKLDRFTRRRKCNVGEIVEVEMIVGLAGRSLQDLANGPCRDPLNLYLPEGKISEAELRERQRQQMQDSGII